MSRRRQHRQEQKQRRHLRPADPRPAAATPDVVPADQVRRLAYTRAQAAEALGVSVQTIDRRVVPAIDTVKTSWGSRLIPVSELERYLAEHTEPARTSHPRTASPGRPAAVPEQVTSRISREHRLGKSLGQIARDLNEAGIPTAQGGRQWWPSTVRTVLLRLSA
jgi:hypothetical protein